MDDKRREELVAASQLLDPENDKHWIKSGKADLQALASLVGNPVSAEERDEALGADFARPAQTVQNAGDQGPENGNQVPEASQESGNAAASSEESNSSAQSAPEKVASGENEEKGQAPVAPAPDPAASGEQTTADEKPSSAPETKEDEQPEDDGEILSFVCVRECFFRGRIHKEGDKVSGTRSEIPHHFEEA